MQKLERQAKIFKALGEPMRLKIIQMISSHEMCACELLEGLVISQSTLSHHMKVLVDCGLVKGRKEATWMHYSLNYEIIAKLQQFIEGLTQAKAGSLCPKHKKECKE